VDLIKQAQNKEQWRALVGTEKQISGSIKGGEYIEYLSNSECPKKTSDT
jgi:hypothetical protein